MTKQRYFGVMKADGSIHTYSDGKNEPLGKEAIKELQLKHPDQVMMDYDIEADSLMEAWDQIRTILVAKKLTSLQEQINCLKTVSEQQPPSDLNHFTEKIKKGEFFPMSARDHNDLNKFLYNQATKIIDEIKHSDRDRVSKYHPKFDELKPLIENLYHMGRAQAPINSWLPYPENKPSVGDEYFVTLIDEDEPSDGAFAGHVYWNNKAKRWSTQLTVTAFMSLPEPYQP